ncbi:MAG: DNA polymerase III subunit gamma/tau [Pseudomonadota bacterium]|nr:DNA polymerase III subunit gamma/tau [Pseudomonadota bacterium]
MSYLVLARKWRPRTFAELVGQDHVRRALVNALKRDQLHHAYLFSGTRGVGKTTVARIFAKALNCEQGVSAEPCGECGSCTAIDAGRFFDLIEVDAASRTGVEDTRELLENVQYAPSQGRYKVYLIDEVHMFSNSSFNALLKTLEEPPPHVKFLFATTDAQKLPVTVVSRCLRFNLHRLTHDLLVEQMRKICAAEGLEAPDGALREIAVAAEGSMRDALSLLDQAIAFLGGALDQAGVREMLGTLSPQHAGALVQAVHQGDGSGVLAQVGEMAPQVADFGVILNDLINLLHQVAIRQLVPDAELPAGSDLSLVDSLAAQLEREEVQLYYQIAVAGRRDLPHLPDPRTAVEMTLLRMLAFRPAESGGSVDAKGGHGTAEAGGEAESAGHTAAQPGDTGSLRAAPAAVVPEQSSGQTGADWEHVVQGLPLAGMTRELAANTRLVERAPGRAILHLATAHQALLNDHTRQELSLALADAWGESVRLQFDIVSSGVEETPAVRRQAALDETLRAAGRSLAEEPVVKQLRKVLGGELDTSQVRLLESAERSE